MSIPFIIASGSITVMVGGKTLTAKSSHPNYETIKDYLKGGAADAAKLAGMFDIAQAITTKTKGLVTITQDRVLYNGQELHNSLTARMLSMLAEGFNIDPLTNFLEKLMQNPSHRAVNGLFDFLAATNIPITPEGDFLAYKKVRDNYLDIHSGTIRNAVGDKPRIARNQVDENPDRTCSHGLHVCSETYLPHFGSCQGNRIMIVQVNPADVVAIPRDYNNAKMRCAGYTVIGEVPAENVSKVFSAAVMGAADFRMQDEGDLSSPRLTAEATDVIRSIHGVPVRFVFDEDCDVWVAYTGGERLDEAEYVLYADDLEDAVGEFIEEYMSEEETFTAEVRWLDDEGDLQKRTVTITSVAGEEAEEWEFTQEIDGVDFTDFRVKNITTVPGSRKWVVSE